MADGVVDAGHDPPPAAGLDEQEDVDVVLTGRVDRRDPGGVFKVTLSIRP